MPLLDVTEILSDPDIADLFDVIRQDEAIDEATGLSVVSGCTTKDVVGVITIATPDDLKRFDTAQITGRCICCVTTFRLRASGEGFQPDLIKWDGARYTVIAIDPYTRFGAGFVEVIALSMNAADPAAK